MQNGSKLQWASVNYLQSAVPEDNGSLEHDTGIE